MYANVGGVRRCPFGIGLVLLVVTGALRMYDFLPQKRVVNLCPAMPIRPIPKFDDILDNEV